MAHIAFFAPPGAGHVYPTLALVAELVGRGHRVSYVSTERFAASLAEVGADRVPYATTLNAAFARPPQFAGNDLVRAMHAAVDEIEATLPDLATAFDTDRPDLVVCDGAAVTWAARMLAARWAVPVVQTWPNLVSNEHWSLGRHYTRFNPLHPRFLTFVLRLRRVLARHGAGLTMADLTRNTGVAAKVVLLPRAFQFAGDTFDDTFHFVGPCLGDRTFQGVWQPETDLPVVLVSLGTGYNRRPEFFRACLDAFAGEPWHVVMAVGDDVRLGPTPPHLEVHPYVPQLDVLRHAALFVTHGGMGSVMESLHAGVPMVAVPQMAEQRANADRLAELGLGVRLDRSAVTAAGLAAAAESVIADVRIRVAVDGMRRTIAETGGAEAAADVVEAALPTHTAR